MIRFPKEHVYDLVFLWCITATIVRCQFPGLRNPTDLQRLNTCVYHNIHYKAGDFVKTGEPCLNCTCNNGIIVCHLRVCSPIPNPPPSGCFILHKKDLCCSELVCNEDNNVLFDGLEGRSRPGLNDDAEMDLENFVKTNRNKGCLINGTTYAEGSALSSSTDCEYCFCMKGKERCVKPMCVLQLAGCTPVFRRHACCPVKYNCHDSDNVTIISTELSFTHASKMTTPEINEELLSFNRVHQNNTSAETKSTERGNTSPMQFIAKTNVVSTLMPFAEGHKYTNVEKESSDMSAPYSTSLESMRSTDIVNSTLETITEISKSISLIETEMTIIKEIEFQGNSNLGNESSIEERRNTFPNLDVHEIDESTSAYDRNSKINFTTKNSLSTTIKSIPAKIDELLNFTKKKQEGEYELDYDQPTLPPSLPNLKIIPFVAADALDKPKDATLEHREDTISATETDILLEPSAPQSGQFSPPAKTEGGFVPRDPTLDGPFFESKYNNIYQPNNNAEMPAEQVSLPSITEPPKLVESALCTNGYLTYRHGELISEPKACNMCLCLYGEIVCQEPECPTVKTGCRRIKYNEHVSNCCGEIVCEDDVTPSALTKFIHESEKYSNTVATVSKLTVANVTEWSEQFNEPDIEANLAPTLPEISSSYITVNTKTKNQTKPEQNTPFVTKTTSTSSIASATDVTTEWQNKSSIRPVSEKLDNDYDNGFSLENMLSFLFDEPPILTKSKNTTVAVSAKNDFLQTSSTLSNAKTTGIFELFTTKTTTEMSTSKPTTAEIPTTLKSTKAETDSAIYMIKNENLQSKNIFNYTDDQTNTIKQINSYYVPPLGNFEEVILNPTKKPFITNKKPSKNTYFSTTFRPRHTTAKVIPLSKPFIDKNVPQVIVGDPGAASGLLKLSGCNIFGKMYRIGKIISELSGPCLQCMCAEVGVHCVPLKC